MTITPKQEAFAQAYIETGNASEAYRRAYNASKMKPEAVSVNASKLLKNAKVALKVTELRERAQERHDINLDTITAMLKKDRELAREKGQASAAVTACMGLAKLHGLIVDKAQVAGDPENPLFPSSVEIRIVGAHNGRPAELTRGK
jgi:phage terminase small subunit